MLLRWVGFLFILFTIVTMTWGHKRHADHLLVGDLDEHDDAIDTASENPGPQKLHYEPPNDGPAHLPNNEDDDPPVDVEYLPAKEPDAPDGNDGVPDDPDKAGHHDDDKHPDNKTSSLPPWYPKTRCTANKKTPPPGDHDHHNDHDDHDQLEAPDQPGPQESHEQNRDYGKLEEPGKPEEPASYPNSSGYLQNPTKKK